ncbi:MAG: hypothetical protein ACTMH4_08790 [Sphingobacterium sp.]
MEKRMNNETFSTYLVKLFRYFEANDQFVFSRRDQEALIRAVDGDVVHTIQERLGLTLLLNEACSQNCYVAENQEMQEAYRQFISPTEFLYFLYGTFLASITENVPPNRLLWPAVLPNETGTFWERIQLGKNRR